jgi:CDGSH iron-sulfur domain-containing protein 3
LPDPIIAQRFPYVLDEKAGERWWCACGRSQAQPFCDGSHKGTEFAPVRVTVEAGKAAWCGCKRSGKKPFCDGAHRKLPPR